MDLSGKTIGVWGYGIGGSALVNFLLKKNCELVVFDQKPFSLEDQNFLQQREIKVAPSLETFFEWSDKIFPSAGIDLRPYSYCSHKFLAELDLFHYFFKKPIVAITGTLGKTTVTSYLAGFLRLAGKKVAVGGNIGVGLCSLIDDQDGVDCAVLEVSSFQLDLCKTFAPTIAVWTNFFPNHLDRHDTLEDYFFAKTRIVSLQNDSDISIVPISIMEKVKKASLHSHTWVAIPEVLPERWVSFIPKQGVLENWLTICSVLTQLEVPLEVIQRPLDVGLKHRVEYVATVSGRSFYNDSKSTVSGATLSALKQFEMPVVLMLGGLSKGVSRQDLIMQLSGKVKFVIAFGKEREQLADWCELYGVSCCISADINEAVELAYNRSAVGDVVLLSPAGSSFDLFKNYQERGDCFKRLVFQLKG